MNFKTSIFALTLSTALLSFSLNASACSTVVVGKNVSETGTILIGHNEDNDLRIVTSQYWVPAADHKANEVITYEPTAAKIPQVAHTFGYYWTQTLHPAGYSFSDGFVNENGVIIVSNNCNQIFDTNESVNEGGVGYGIRRLMAERAKTARQAIDVAIELQTKYGYTSEGRTYTVADKNEAWQIMLLKGHRYIARKVQDDEVTYIANAFSLDKLDVADKDLIVSADLIEHAIKTGRYKPAKKGDYSDFSFRKAYQPRERRAADWNKDRAQTAWEMLTGIENNDEESYPYSIKPTKKLGVKDVQNILSGHFKHEKRDSGFYHQSMRDICNVGTFESVVYEQDSHPLFIKGWKTFARPCQTAYIPFFPLSKPNNYQHFMSPEVATAQHFHASSDRFDYKPELALYKFLSMQNLLDYVGPNYGSDYYKRIDKMEMKWFEESDSVIKKAKYLEKAVSKAKAEEFLHQYGTQAMQDTISMVEVEFAKLKPLSIAVQADSLSMSKNSDIEVVVFGSKDVDVTQAKKESFVFGVTYPNPDVDVNLDRAHAKTMQIKDVDGDGTKDLILTFSTKNATKYTFENVNTDLWLFGQFGESRKGGFDVVKITK